MQNHSLYLEAPHYKAMEEINNKSLFIGGGISGCEDWQTPLCVKLLNNTNLQLFNPRRHSFDISKLEESEIQIKWEHHYLHQADMILFWFPNTSVCPITLFEYGYWLAKGKKIYLGIEKGYVRQFDLQLQTSLEQNIIIHSSLDGLAEAIIKDNN
jgi:nucleoside 2-deoxyribosyltransferase